MPRPVPSRLLLAPLARSQPRPSNMQKPKAEWADALSKTLGAERQRREARAWVCNETVDECRDAPKLLAHLRALKKGDLGRKFNDGRTLGHLANDWGRAYFLAAYLDAGGPWTKPPSAPPVRGVDPRGVKLCKALVRGWPGNRRGVQRSLAGHSSDLPTFLLGGVVGVRRKAVARKRALVFYIDWIRRRAEARLLFFAGPPPPELADVVAPTASHQLAQSLLGGTSEPLASPRCKTPRSRTAQIMRRSGIKLKTLQDIKTPARPAPSPEIAAWLESQGLGRLLTAPAPAPAPAAVKPLAALPKKAPGKMKPSPRVAASPRSEGLTCGICLSLYKDPVYTPCQHVFCGACLREAIRRAPPGKKRCPICRKALPANALKRCGGALVGRIAQIRGDEDAIQAAYHPRLSVMGIGQRCAASLTERNSLANSRGVALDDVRRKGSALAAALAVQRLALAVAILCHPNTELSLRDRVLSYV
mmetsp:Transcript_28001/g.83921  ORF Transcript_28001/g.83921 Transcript_28001/m.83921 type:complete len:475 (-) Transcript_28001:22-1446(-)